MSDITVIDLANQMRYGASARTRSVLLIGYDGGSALINHARPARMLEEMRRERNPTTTASFEKIGKYWDLLGTSTARMLFMEEHTRPTDAELPDIAAINCIAQLLKQNYLAAVVATDVSRVLYERLNAQVSMRHLNLVESRPQVLGSAIRSSEKIFVDAGELLLYECSPGRHDVNAASMLESADQLKSFIASFDQVYCWGWCDLNMSLNSIYKSYQDRKIHVLGHYSACALVRPENGRIIVDTGEPAQKGATTNILINLAAELNLDQSASASDTTLGPSFGHRVPMGEATNGSRRPLLTVEVLERMKDRVTAYPLSIIGVESARVREDTALWLLDGLSRMGPTMYQSGGDLVGLARRLAIQAGAPGWTVIGELGGSKLASWGPFGSLILAWQQALVNTKATGTRIALLCPVEVSEWAHKQGRSDELWVESHYEREYLLPDSLAEWLMGALLSMELGLAGGDVLRLADLMLTDAVSRQPVTDVELTWWPDMLALWLQRLTGALPSLSDLAPPGKDVNAYEQIDWLHRHWIDLLDEMQRVTTSLEPMFELKPVLRVQSEPLDGIDFNIQARESEAQPADVAPADDGGNSGRTFI